MTRLLSNVPSGTRVTVFGITDRTFTQPSILLSARISDDPGYFGERLVAARKQLLRTWIARSAKLVPRSRYTDVIGAFLLAAKIFEPEVADHKTLVVLSDMRHHTRELDFESSAVVPEFSQLAGKMKSPMADLRGVGVYVVGVDGAEKPISYWTGLQMLWVDYLGNAGAQVRAYSVMRELPMSEDLERPQ